MRNLTGAHEQLFRRTADETFPSFDVLLKHCQWQKQQAAELWQPPLTLDMKPVDGGRLVLATEDDRRFEMNDWSFGQVCRLAGVTKETVNRLSADTAAQVFRETLPQGNKPLQLFTQTDQLRSIHPASYTRLFNADLLEVVDEFAHDFEPPPKGVGDATGLYGGEQDTFAFLIDPTGWTEIGGEAFAPGFFCWNSETGARTVGIQTFWFQAICQNHIVWDAVEVVEVTRKHTASVHQSLNEIRQAIESLVRRRDARRDGFAQVITKAMNTRLGDDAEEVQKVLLQNGISGALAKKALKLAQSQGAFTIFAMVDAITRLSGQMAYAGQRTEVDQKAARLLALAV